MTRRFLGFALVSGLGWLLDVGSTAALVNVGIAPFAASFAGALAAVTFVYVISRLAVFDQARLGRVSDWALYSVWQLFAISVASLLVAALAYLLEPAAGHLAAVWTDRLGPNVPVPLALATGAAKVVVTPLTLTANFFFMKWLVQRGRSVEADLAMGGRS